MAYGAASTAVPNFVELCQNYAYKIMLLDSKIMLTKWQRFCLLIKTKR